MDKGTEPLILTYHSISDGRPPLCTSPSLFREQVEWLSANARVIALSELVGAVVGGQRLPARAVVLTFDDALQDFYTQAAPVLRQLGLPATVFVPTGHCGGASLWHRNPAGGEERPLMSWAQVCELAKQGFELGAHSVRHLLLTEVPLAEAEREIVDSKAALESKTGRTVEFFCYPYGHWNAAVREVVKAHYRAACSTATGAVGQNADLFALPRVDSYYLRRPSLFRQLFRRQTRTYLGLRRVLRRLRGLGEAS